MTKTELRAIHALELAQRQRRFEWELARDEQTRAAARLVAGKTHDLLNLVQIIQLASHELVRRCDAESQEFIADLQRAAVDAERSLKELMAVARPDEVIVRGSPIGAVVTAAIAALRPAIAIDIHLATPPDIATRCTAEELEHILIGLALDAITDDQSLDDLPIELFVRERTIDRKPWIEIVRGSAAPPRPGERFELRAVEAIAARAGGELATAERRDGGEELVVALPVM